MNKLAAADPTTSIERQDWSAGNAPPDGRRTLRNFSVILVSLVGIYAIFPSALLPALVSSWTQHLNVGNDIAGLIATSGLMGQTGGLLLAIGLISRWSLFRIGAVGLALAVGGEIGSILASTTYSMAAFRFANGIALGLLFGAVVNWLGRRPHPDRAFGVFTFLQFTVPSAIFLTLPYLVQPLGHRAIYGWALVLAFVAGLCLNQLKSAEDGGLADLKSSDQHMQHPFLAVLSVASFAFFSMSAVGSWAFVINYGEAQGLAFASAAQAVALSSAFGVIGSFLVMLTGTRFGRFRTAALGYILFFCALLALAVGGTSPVGYYIKLSMVSLIWAFLFPYMQGTQEALDRSGKLSVWGMVGACIGAGIGPAIVGNVIANFGFESAFAVAALGISISAVLLLPAAWVAPSIPSAGATGPSRQGH